MQTSKQTRDRARIFRRRMDLPEVLLWNAIRTKRLDGLRFRRQHPEGPYCLDFYCPELGLAVEIDGYSHDVADQPVRDERRDAWLAERGIFTLRVSASDVLHRLDEVLAAILATARGVW